MTTFRPLSETDLLDKAKKGVDKRWNVDTLEKLVKYNQAATASIQSELLDYSIRKKYSEAIAKFKGISISEEFQDHIGAEGIVFLGESELSRNFLF